MDGDLKLLFLAVGVKDTRWGLKAVVDAGAGDALPIGALHELHVKVGAWPGRRGEGEGGGWGNVDKLAAFLRAPS